MSWAYSGDPEAISEVSRWPCHERRGQDEVQIPTQVDLNTKRWGYLVPNDTNPIRWFKLLLLNPEDAKEDVKKSKFLNDVRAKLQDYIGYESDGIIDIVADFLKELWNHALKEINREIDIDVLPFRVAITIPAIWPQYARVKMKEAAVKAGIMEPRPIGDTTIILVEEPEAAALSILYERREYPEVGVSILARYCPASNIHRGPSWVTLNYKDLTLCWKC